MPETVDAPDRLKPPIPKSVITVLNVYAVPGVVVEAAEVPDRLWPFRLAVVGSVRCLDHNLAQEDAKVAARLPNTIPVQYAVGHRGASLAMARVTLANPRKLSAYTASNIKLMSTCILLRYCSSIQDSIFYGVLDSNGGCSVAYM